MRLLKVAGTGSSEPGLRRLVPDLGLGDRVTLLGKVLNMDVHSLYAARFVVVPSVRTSASASRGLWVSTKPCRLAPSPSPSPSPLPSPPTQLAQSKTVWSRRVAPSSSPERLTR